MSHTYLLRCVTFKYNHHTCFLTGYSNDLIFPIGWDWGVEDQKIDFDLFVEDKPAPKQNVCLQVMEVGQEVLEVRTKT